MHLDLACHISFKKPTGSPRLGCLLTGIRQPGRRLPGHVRGQLLWQRLRPGQRRGQRLFECAGEQGNAAGAL